MNVAPWTVLIILVPAAVALWTGARILRTREEPNLEERWKKRSEILVAALVYCGAALGFTTENWLAAFTTMLIATVAAGYPARRSLFGETWGLAGYLFQTGRVFLAFSGYLVAVAITPFLLTKVPEAWDLAAGGAAAVLLLAWGRTQHAWSRVLLGGERLDGGTLSAAPSPSEDARLAEGAEGRSEGLGPALSALIGRARVSSAVRVYAVGDPRSRWPAAFAQPGSDHSQVLVSRTLVAHLEPEELEAVVGHELAHLEMWPRARLIRTAVLLDFPLVAGAAFLLPLTQRTAPALSDYVPLAWFLIVLGVLALVQARRQEEETASDLRAAELVGDAEQMATALEKVHQLGLIPRASASPREAWLASHPSLQQRLRSLREHTPPPEPPPAVPIDDLVLEAPDARPGRCVAVKNGGAIRLEAKTLHREGPSGELLRTVPFSGLHAVRLERLRAGPQLTMVDIDGASATVLLDADAETINDLESDLRARVEPQLAPAPSPPRGVALLSLSPIVLALLLLASLAGGLSWSVLPAIFVGIFVRRPAPLAAAGAAAVVALSRPTMAMESADVAGVFILALGVAAVLLGLFEGRISKPPFGLKPALLVTAVPAGLALLSLGLALAPAPSVASLPALLGEVGWGAPLSAGAAAALATARRPRLAALATLFTAILGIAIFPALARLIFPADPFLAAPLLRAESPPRAPMGRVELRIPGLIPQLEVAPDGEYFALPLDAEVEAVPSIEAQPFDEDLPDSRYVVSDLSGRTATVAANQLLLLGGGRFMGLARGSARRNELKVYELLADGARPLARYVLAKGFATFRENTDSPTVAVSSFSRGGPTRMHLLRFDTQGSLTSSTTALEEEVPMIWSTMSRGQRWSLEYPGRDHEFTGLWPLGLWSAPLPSRLVGEDGTVVVQGRQLECAALESEGTIPLVCKADAVGSVAFVGVDTSRRSVHPIGRIPIEFGEGMGLWSYGTRHAAYASWEGQVAVVTFASASYFTYSRAPVPESVTFMAAVGGQRLFAATYAGDKLDVDVFELSTRGPAP